MSIRMKLAAFWASIALAVISSVVVLSCFLVSNSLFHRHRGTFGVASLAAALFLLVLVVRLECGCEFPFYRTDALAAMRWCKFTSFGLGYFPASERTRQHIVETGWAKANFFEPLARYAVNVFRARDTANEVLREAQDVLDHPPSDALNPIEFAKWEAWALKRKQIAEKRCAKANRKADRASKHFNAGWDFLVELLGKRVTQEEPLRNTRELLNHVAAKLRQEQAGS